MVGKVSIGVAAIEIAVMLLISFGISRLLGWTLTDALFLGTALASSSTTIIAKVLSDMGKLHETPALIMLGLLFGLSIIAHILGFSVAIGAFLMGVIVAGSRYVGHINNLIAPIKDMFAAVFFVSMGALINVTQFQDYIIPALIITALMVFGKMLGCGLGTRAFGYNFSTSLKVGLGMSQIGEFAFIVMKVGQDRNLISPFLFPIIGVAAVITTFLTPYLIKFSYRIKLPETILKKSRGK